MVKIPCIAVLMSTDNNDLFFTLELLIMLMIMIMIMVMVMVMIIIIYYQSIHTKNLCHVW